MFRKLFSKHFGEGKVKNKILQYLNEKYNEEFEIVELVYEVVDSRFPEKNHYTGVIYPKNTPYRRFRTKSLNKEGFKVVGDTYMDVLMSEQMKRDMTPIITDMFGNIVHGDADINHSCGFADISINDKNTTYHDYLKQVKRNPNDNAEVYINIDIFIPFYEEIDKEYEEYRINNFICKLKELGLHSVRGNIFYFKPQIYDYIKNMNVRQIYDIVDIDIWKGEGTYNVCEFEQKDDSNKVKLYYYK